MIPFAELSYFLLLAILLLPTIIYGLIDRKIDKYNMVVGLICILLIFKNSLGEFVFFISFLIWEVALIRTYLKYRQNRNERNIFYLSVVLSLIPIFLVKIPNVSLIGFLGISYVTFKVVQMIIEARDGLIKDASLYQVIRFLLFFPSFTSGPIDRYRRFEKDLEQTTYQAGEYKELLYLGIHRIFLGFLYKFIIAYLINFHFLQSNYVQEDSFGATVVYMYAYSLYLFFDFAGYTHFAIGISYLMGVRTPENFNMPFISRNIKDFWNRWHMSLSFWFRDYVYMRLVMFLTKQRKIKNRQAISYISYFVLFLLMGVWHGVALHYIIYGLYHAVLIISYDWFDRKNKQHKWIPKTKMTHILSVIITFHTICFGLLIFSGRLF